MRGPLSREELRSMLERKRMGFLTQMRGRSGAYDEVRLLASYLAKATGAREEIVPLIEGALIMQLESAREVAKVERDKAVKLAVEGERARILGAIGKA